MLRTAVHTESKRDSPRFDWHTVFFVCAADDTLVRMHQWYKLFRKACMIFFFAFVLVLFLRRVLLHCCARYVCHRAVYMRIICFVCRLWYALVFLCCTSFYVKLTGYTCFCLKKLFFVCFGTSTYSIENGYIQQAMVQCDLTTEVYFDNIRKPFVF